MLKFQKTRQKNQQLFTAGFILWAYVEMKKPKQQIPVY